MSYEKGSPLIGNFRLYLVKPTARMHEATLRDFLTGAARALTRYAMILPAQPSRSCRELLGTTSFRSKASSRSLVSTSCGSAMRSSPARSSQGISPLLAFAWLPQIIFVGMTRRPMDSGSVRLCTTGRHPRQITRSPKTLWDYFVSGSLQAKMCSRTHKRPNQVLELAATRRVFTFQMIKLVSVGVSLVPGDSSSAYYR